MDDETNLVSSDHAELDTNPKSPKDSLVDSPLCKRCQSLDLASLVRLQFADVDLEDSFAGREELAGAVDWCEQTGGKGFDEACRPCGIFRNVEYRRDDSRSIYASSARTLIQSNEIEDTLLFEIIGNVTRFLAPGLQQQEHRSG